MKKHTIVYLDYFNHPTYIQCEVCNAIAVDIHHIQKRSYFWKKTKHLQDVIENLIALCRVCHEKAESHELSKEELKNIHLWHI